MCRLEGSGLGFVSACQWHRRFMGCRRGLYTPLVLHHIVLHYWCMVGVCVFNIACVHFPRIYIHGTVWAGMVLCVVYRGNYLVRVVHRPSMRGDLHMVACVVMCSLLCCFYYCPNELGSHQHWFVVAAVQGVMAASLAWQACAGATKFCCECSMNGPPLPDYQ